MSIYLFPTIALIQCFFFLSCVLISRKNCGNNLAVSRARAPSCTDSDSNENRCVSIIVPAYNEEKNVAKCIESIQAQDYKGEIEVIVVNDGSTDMTAAVVSGYQLKLIDLKVNLGKSNALNVGIENSKGEILIFSDADSRMASDAVSLLVKCLDEHPEMDVVAGNVLISEEQNKKNLFDCFQMIEYWIAWKINRFIQSLGGAVLVCPGTLFAVRRRVTEEVMFSDKSVVEDADFTIEVSKKSIKTTREPNAKVYTNSLPSVGGWFRQRSRWWYGYLQLWRIHRTWAVRNPLMILNYLGFIFSLLSLGLTVFSVFLLSAYSDASMMLLLAIAYCGASVILFTGLCLSPNSKAKKLIPLLVPYTLVYLTMRIIVQSYLYVRYLSGRGISVRFGPRTIKIK
jgi:cellulose synthase/poly-beta-1,6-N-acetylglucosamine synthase-like glycosyltransferase